jgi:ferrous iron transport protein B
VGNYPGVTVEKKSARFARAGRTIEMVGLPGVYSLLAASPEESHRPRRNPVGACRVVIQVTTRRTWSATCI